MKMKLKLSILAGALASALVGQANASVVNTTNSTGSDLVLTVFDSTSDTTYTRDLGTNMSTFTAGVSGTASSLTATGPGDLSFAADSNLTSFLAGVGTDTVWWSVTAAKTGALAFNGESAMVTYSGLTMSTLTSNGNMGNAIGDFNSYYTSADGLQGTTSSSDVTSTIATANVTALYTQLKSTATPGVPNTSVASLGSSLDFIYITPSSASSVGKVSTAAFGAANGGDVWSLSSAGNLTYTVASVAAVPEPSEWLLMLSGFGLAGFIATRRKNRANAVTFA